MTYSDLRRQLSAAIAGRARATLSLDGFRRAGVLVPVVFAPDGPELLFTRRTEEVLSHKGQISFPEGWPKSPTATSRERPSVRPTKSWGSPTGL